MSNIEVPGVFASEMQGTSGSTHVPDAAPCGATPSPVLSVESSSASAAPAPFIGPQPSVESFAEMDLHEAIRSGAIPPTSKIISTHLGNPEEVRDPSTHSKMLSMVGEEDMTPELKERFRTARAKIDAALAKESQEVKTLAAIKTELATLWAKDHGDATRLELLAALLTCTNNYMHSVVKSLGEDFGVKIQFDMSTASVPYKDNKILVKGEMVVTDWGRLEK